MSRARDLISVLEKKGTISLDKIKLERGIALVDTRDPQNIIDAYRNGKMPLDSGKVKAMATLLKQGVDLPPVVLGKGNLLKDGHHRYAAYKMVGRVSISYEK